MKILMVGWQGMLGTDLVGVLSTRHQLLMPSLEELDITRPEQCDAWIKSTGPEAVVCAAALTNVDYCETHEAEAFLINGQGIGNLAAACAQAGSLLVHYSTDYVFDGRKLEPYIEEDPPNPISVYGKSKLRGEELLRIHASKHLLLRISWLYGRNGKNFIRTILNAARSKPELRVVNDQKGSPTYTRDVASYTEMMMEAGAQGTYHLTNSGSCTWYELARQAVEWAGIRGVNITPVTTAEFPLPAARPANSVLANSRLAREGFPAMRHWSLAVRDYLREIE